ncbi:hypothetical protein BGZ65_001708 [Modicella reniformis]|uniref:Uncharacterized protein n=1 Tax=Modicella reniformis TaxID=1440133 RepID=A0A9P6MMN4_9FUNG|nr:hypothetical protein BGZ65_001708 [Modicella reniformis]
MRSDNPFQPPPQQQYHQKFRTSTLSEVSSPTATITIWTHQDPRTGHRFILWRDIQLVFKNAQYIKNGDALVSFVTDEDFEEISYHPGIILDVVVDHDPEQAQSDSTEPTMIPSQESFSTTTTLNEGEADSIAEDMNRISLSPPMSHQHKPQDPATTTVPEGFVKACFRKLDIEIDNNRVFRAEVALEMMHNRVFREEMTEGVQQVNSRLTIIQKRVESLIRQTYELHEYPIPRLFIVLPKIAIRRRDKLTAKPYMKQFRLFFLCECGEHTKTEGSKIPHEIHLAKHEGYDLDRATEFFEKYGSYVVTIMEMIKFGCSVAGIVVPALVQFKLAERINSVQKNMEFSSSSAGVVVDDMIKYIQDQQNAANNDTLGKSKAKGEEEEDRYGLDRLEVLEGADLRLLESYLRIKDEGRALGNLFRMVTPEGHVKWVCMNHYRENYRTSVMQHLRDTVDANNGSYSEAFGKIQIKLLNALVARQFYEAIVKARGVQELDVTLNWDATLDDLRTFASAVAAASIVNLTIDGRSFKGPSRDFMNSGRRFDPLLQLMFNGRIQSLRIDHCREFYQRIGYPSIVASPLLRVLHLDSMLTPKDKAAFAIFKKILDKSPLLMELTVRSDDFVVVLDTITSSYPNHKLEILHLKSLHLAVSIQFSQGKIQNVKADMRDLNELFGQLQFTTKGILTALRVKCTRIDQSFKVEKVLEHNPNLTDIEVAGEAGVFNEVINIVTKARNVVNSRGFTTSLRQLRLETYNSDNTDGHQGEHNDKVTMTVDFADHSTDVSSSSANVEMRSNLLTDLLEHQGSCIQNLSTNRAFDDRHAAALHKSTESRCSIKTLKLDLTSLTATGLDSVDTIIERSKDLENLVMEFQDLYDRRQQAKAVRSLILHGNLLYGLTLRGHQDALWLVEIGTALPNRSYLSKLQSLRVTCQSTSIPDACATWLAAMLQAPPNLFSTGSSSSHSSTSPTSSRRMSSWSSLREIRIECMTLSSENWALIIRAIDFSALESLNFESSNFEFDQLALLVECIPDHDEIDVPLKALYVKNTSLRSCNISTDLSKDSYTNQESPLKTIEDLQELESKFEEKAPMAQIMGLWPQQS